MSGHSKWSQIKHKKGIADAKKGVAFGKIARAISIAARDNPDPASNLRLKAEIERARAVNMPSESIERAIKRVADKSASALVEVQLELIGPGGAAIVVNAITDNSNRTINELKQIATKLGGRMVDRGSVLWMFSRSPRALIPTTIIPVTDLNERSRLDMLIETLDEHDDVQDVFTNADS